MNNVSRCLITLDMLSQELKDVQDNGLSDIYLKLLRQFLAQLGKLAQASETLTELGFTQAVDSSGLCTQIRTKRMIDIHQRLIQFVLDYYEASHKASAILETEFGEHADKRLNLLQTRAIKARSQYRTVAGALGREDYERFTGSLALPAEDWGWSVLGVS